MLAGLLRPLSTLLRRARRRVLLHRRGLAALAAAVAVLLGVQAARPVPAPTVSVWAAARALQGGALLGETSLTTLEVPPELVPEGAVTDPAAVLGRPLASPVARGEVLTSVRVVGPDLAQAYPGSTAVPVRFADAEVVELLRPGDRVDVVAAPQDGRAPAAVVVSDVPVVAVPRPAAQPYATGAPGRLVVLAVPSAEAAAVAAATATAVLIPVWSR
jgi:pilus assembly protein CpaB